MVGLLSTVRYLTPTPESHQPDVVSRYLNDELMGPQYLPALKAHYRWTANGDPDHPAWAVLSAAGAPQHRIRFCP